MGLAYKGRARCALSEVFVRWIVGGPFADVALQRVSARSCKNFIAQYCDLSDLVFGLRRQCSPTWSANAQHKSYPHSP